MANRATASRPPRSSADVLLARSLSAFHTAALTVLLVGVAHQVGGLGSALAGIGTLSGIVLFLALWATTWWTTHRALDRLTFEEARDEPWPAVLEPATIWGGVNGVAFFVALILVRAVQTALNGSEQLTVEDVGAFFAVLLFGALPAVVVGSVVGMAFGLIDRFALGIGVALAQPGNGDEDRTGDGEGPELGIASQV